MLLKKWMRDEIEELPSGDSLDPTTERRPRDQIVGVIEDLQVRGLCRLWIHHYQLIEEARTAKDLPLLNDAEREDRTKYCEFLLAKHEEVNKLLWSTLKQEFPALEGKPGLAVCKDWWVVWGVTEYEEEDEEDEFPLDPFFSFPPEAFEPEDPENLEEITAGSFLESWDPTGHQN